MRKRHTQEERDELIRAVTIRRESVAVVAARTGITEVTAYRWLRAAPKSAVELTPRFVELVPSRPQPSLVVRIGEVEIEVRAGFDEVLLRAVVSALRGAS